MTLPCFASLAKHYRSIEWSDIKTRIAQTVEAIYKRRLLKGEGWGGGVKNVGIYLEKDHKGGGGLQNRRNGSTSFMDDP